MHACNYRIEVSITYRSGLIHSTNCTSIVYSVMSIHRQILKFADETILFLFGYKEKKTHDQIY